MRIYKSFFRFEKCRKACKYRLYRLMRTYKEIVKNYILISTKLITDILPNFIKDNKEYTEEEKAEKEQTRVLFQRFATAFTNYFNQRRNNFSEDNISTAISFRIVNENSEIHLQNMRAFQRIEIGRASCRERV